MAGTGPLTLESALGLLSAGSEDDPAMRPDGSDGKSESIAATDDGETIRGTEQEADTESDSPVEPPASWKAADRELFGTLPKALQERIASREQERERAVNEALRESASQRKAAENERAARDSERHALQQRLDSLALGLQQQLASEFGEIRSPADLIALAQKDPARYAVLRAKQDALQQAHVEQQHNQAQAMEQQSVQLRAFAEGEKAALIAKRPDLKDKTTRERFARDLKDYAVSVGYTPEQFDGNLSHVNLLVLEKAMLYDRAKRARAEAEVRPVPRVQQPGTGATRGERAAEHRVARLKRLERSGRIEDAVGLLRI